MVPFKCHVKKKVMMWKCVFRAKFLSFIDI